MPRNCEKRTFFYFFKQKNDENIFLSKKSCTFASHLSLGLWCNGNTADSGPAFPGSSPGSPTERFPFGNLFFYAIYVIRHVKRLTFKLNCTPKVLCLTFGVQFKVWGNLKSYPAVDFTINQLSYILFVVVLSCSFLKKRTKNFGTRAHQPLTPPARELHCNSRAKLYSN